MKRIIPLVFAIFVILGFLLYFICNAAALGFKVNADFPSGNIAIEKIKNDTVWMHPDLRDTKGDWFYWCFAVKKAKGKTLTFMFTKPTVFTVKGPTVSLNGGFNWKWIGGESFKKTSFSYTFKTNDEVRFSMGMHYVQKQFDMFIKSLLKSEYVKSDALAKTGSGRDIERITIKPANSGIKYKVLITARHHACEMMANYEIEGMIGEILKDEWLKNNIEFCFIPFMDKDGVEKGDQGKNRAPHDHWADYGGTSIYESTAALRRWVPGWSENKLVVTLDLHCPNITGASHEHITLTGSSDGKIAQQEKLFCRLLQSVNSGELKVHENFYMPWGTDWNNRSLYNPGELTFTQWASAIDGVRLPISVEFPYANHEGQTITQENSRAFGVDLMKAIKIYLLQL